MTTIIGYDITDEENPQPIKVDSYGGHGSIYCESYNWADTFDISGEEDFVSVDDWLAEHEGEDWFLKSNEH